MGWQSLLTPATSYLGMVGELDIVGARADGIGHTAHLARVVSIGAVLRGVFGARKGNL